MKINLLINSDMVRAGYVNVDPLATSNDTDKINGAVDNLDYLVDDAEATDIIADNVLDFLPAIYLDNILSGWIKKLRHGGKITISGIDILVVSKAFVRGDLELTEVNSLLYGQQIAPWDYRKSTLTLQSLVTVLQNLGLKIIMKRVVEFGYVVQAERK